MFHSKKTLGLPGDLAVIEVPETTLEEKRKDRSKNQILNQDLV
jgi:hypothetical protein